jgi:hypothetical protein
MSSYEYYHHHLTITGPEIERRFFCIDCFSRDSTDRTNFDFDKLIPQPEHIKESARTNPQFGVDLPDWCVWRCQNWGTAGNACRTEVVWEGAATLLVFYTAFEPPVPIFEELARRFPNLKIEGTWTETEYRYGGNLLCQNGKFEFEDKSEEIRAMFEAFMNDTSARRSTAANCK